jgi:hypothetical protein
LGASGSLDDDFKTFAKAQIKTGDLDPTYWLLKRAYAREGLTKDIALWRTLLYVTWYHLGSSEKMWTLFRFPQKIREQFVKGLSTGTERRGFRGNVNAAAFINDVLNRAATCGGTLHGWIERVAGGHLWAFGWNNIQVELMMVKNAGPWASYKWADLLKNVHNYDITAPDLGVGGGSATAGPIPGMVRLTGKDWKQCATDIGLQCALLDRYVAEGVPFSGLDQLETALCDFNSLCKGGYYVGHDIDGMMSNLPPNSPLWLSRDVFTESVRGERQGWNGVRKERKSVYKNTGRIILPWEQM